MAEYGGLQATDEGGMKYVLQDWQGSTRAVVGNTGNIQSRSDYTAFGEQVSSDTGLRSGTQGFGKPDALRQKYGLTERDDATGLDHTWFRKHENQAGRWTSPDPYNGSMNLGDPQSFNRYSYVISQPTNFVDPSGLLLVITRCETVVTIFWNEDGTINAVWVSYENCSQTIIGIGGGPSNPSNGEGGGIGIGGGGPQILENTRESDCNKWLGKALDRFRDFVAELAKFDPVEDRKGGHLRCSNVSPDSHPP